MTLLYHHCIDLEKIIFGEIKGDIKHSEDDDFKKAYKWLEGEVGFYPLFLSVGATEEDMRMTGYQNQWRRLIVMSKERNEYRKKGEFPNYVLFSFEEVEGVFMDFDNWNLYALNNCMNNKPVTDCGRKIIFEKFWTKSRWLRRVKRNPGTVQLVTPKLYLPDAKRIFVRNKKTKELLESKGFRNVRVKRIPVGS